MTHARTLPRYACLAGLVAGLLAPVHALASPSAEIRSVQYAGTSTPTHINTKVRAAYRFSANDPKFYHKFSLAVSRESLRKGALAALSRGVMHPGLALAIAAVGFVMSQDGHDILAPDSDGLMDSDIDSTFPDVPGMWESVYSTYSAARQAKIDANFYDFLIPTDAFPSTNNTFRVVHECRYYNASGDLRYCSQQNVAITFTPSDPSTADYQGYQMPDPEPLLVPATESDMGKLDEHLPGTIIDDLWADDPVAIPQEWADAISILPYSDPSPAGQAAPEVHQGVSRWAENMTARMQDEALPYPDPGVSPEGNTAAEEIVDRMDEEPPDYPNEPEPVWNVVEIDELPDYNASIGSGQCPGPHHINFPFFGSISLNWQPACDLASNIRGAVIALGYILGLLIVVGRK